MLGVDLAFPTHYQDISSSVLKSTLVADRTVSSSKHYLVDLFEAEFLLIFCTLELSEKICGKG
jgi:hypothetical protein